ncbi:hypothetical protein ACOME3_002219 [Neoechinorhynchus agilis]
MPVKSRCYILRFPMVQSIELFNQFLDVRYRLKPINFPYHQGVVKWTFGLNPCLSESKGSKSTIEDGSQRKRGRNTSLKGRGTLFLGRIRTDSYKTHNRKFLRVKVILCASTM